MIRIIPLSQTESNYEQVITLDGEDYILRLLWNERDSHWFITIRDSSGVDIVGGIKIVADAPIVHHETDDRMWPGQLWCIDTTGTETDPGLRDFGTRCLLMYVDEDNAP